MGVFAWGNTKGRSRGPPIRRVGLAKAIMYHHLARHRGRASFDAGAHGERECRNVETCSHVSGQRGIQSSGAGIYSWSGGEHLGGQA